MRWQSAPPQSQGPGKRKDYQNDRDLCLARTNCHIPASSVNMTLTFLRP